MKPLTVAVDPSDQAILAAIRAVRHRLAPPESRRERLARAIYVPIVNQLALRARRSNQNDYGGNNPEVVELFDQSQGQLARLSIDRIVLLKLDHLGDFIISMRAFQMIREGFPHAHITLVCARWNETFARSLGWFDKIVVFDFFAELNRNWSSPTEELLNSVHQLDLGTYDLAIDLRHDVDTRPCLYRVDAAIRAGFVAPVEEGLPYLDLAVPNTEGIAIAPDRFLTTSLHAEFRLELLAAAVVAAFGVKRPHPAAALVRPRCDAQRRYGVLAIGAGDPIRSWPIIRYAEVGRALIERFNLDIVVLGGAAEQADAERLAEILPTERVELVIGLPLAEIPQLLAGAALCVCNGSGISHLAAALGVATVCILSGASRMSVWRPAGPRAVAVGGMTPCQPCGLRRPDECPYDVACLLSVSSARVLEICERLMNSTESSASKSYLSAVEAP